MAQIEDFIPWLKDAAAELRQAGFNTEADELDSVITSAWVSSSEMCGEIGITMKNIKKNLKTKLSKQVKVAFDRSMREIRKVWPGM